jgi:hypothetical protein
MECRFCGCIEDITWEFINGAWASAITICQLNKRLKNNKKFLPILQSDGTLLYDASLENGYVKLSNDVDNSFGNLEYEGNLPPTFVATFEISHSTGNVTAADAMYFYFLCNETPRDEDGASAEKILWSLVSGYLVSFDELESAIWIVYNGELLYSTDFEFQQDIWYSIKIEYSNGHFEVYVDDQLMIDVKDLTIRDKFTKFGVGGRTGEITAEHRLRNLKIHYSENFVCTICNCKECPQ